MARTAYRNIARVRSTQGLNGEVVVVPIDDLPFLLSEGMEVFLTPPPLQGIRSATVESIRPLAKGWGVRFSGVDSLEAAHQLVGRTCLVDRELLDEELLQEEDDDLGVGLVLSDAEHGVLGTVVEVLETKAGYIWILEGEYGEVLVPAVDEYVVEETEEGLLLDLPRGLVELNR